MTLASLQKTDVALVSLQKTDVTLALPINIWCWSLNIMYLFYQGTIEIALCGEPCKIVGNSGNKSSKLYWLQWGKESSVLEYVGWGDLFCLFV